MSFWSSLGDGLAKGVSGIVSSLGGSFISDLLGYGSADQAERLADYTAEVNFQKSALLQSNQNNFTERMWNQNNQYNSAAAQVDRMRAAGLNPLSGSVSAGQAQQVSGGSSSVGSSTSGAQGAEAAMPAFIGQIAQAQLLSEQTRGQKIQNDLTSYFGATEKAMTLRQQAMEIFKAGWATEEHKATAHKLMKEADYIDSLTTGVDLDNMFKPSLLQGQVNELNAKTKEILNGITVANAEVKIKQALAASEIDLNSKHAKMFVEQTKVFTEQVENVKADTKLTEAQKSEAINRAANEYQEWLIKKSRADFAKNNPKWNNFFLIGSEIMGSVAGVIGAGAGVLGAGASLRRAMRNR